MIHPCPKPPPREKRPRKGLKAKNKAPVPAKTRKFVKERDNETCQCCGRPYHDIHHIIKRSQAMGQPWKHDPRNLECLCYECHLKTELHQSFRRERERQAVLKWGWLAGRPMTLEEWKDWRLLNG